ncbi:unnamed protein product, partial [Polarella glacialis]
MAVAAGATKLPACGFSVSAGKKGNLPLSVEKRPKGKKVTIISNVQGSAKSLLSALSSLLGCGGTLRQEASGVHWTLEIQGDQTERVSTALTQLGCLRGIKKEVDPKDKKKVVEVSRVCAYDKFLRRAEPGKEVSSLIGVAYASQLLPGAECTKWHGEWPYCRGRCEKTDMRDVFDERHDHDNAGGEAVDFTSPTPVSSTAELNIILRSMGMLAEVGEAAKAWGRNVVVAPADRGGLQVRHHVGSGYSLGDYRRVAINPGSTLLEWEDPRNKTTAASRVAARHASRGAPSGSRSQSSGPSRRPAAPTRPPPAPPRLGIFPCPFCGSMFGLHKTLKLHVRNVHPGQQCPRPGAAGAAPPAPAVSVLRSRTPAPPAPTNTVPGFTPEIVTEVFPRINVSVGGSTGSRSQPATSTVRASQAQSAAKQLLHDPPAADKVAPSTYERPRREQKSPCPICSVYFLHERIEAHVEACLTASQAAAASSESEGSDDLGFWAETIAEGAALSLSKTGQSEANPTSAALEIFLVLEDFQPNQEAQLHVRRGDKVHVVWQQPPEEGGYWAYGCLAQQPERVGYVPLENMAPLQDAKGAEASSAETCDAPGVGSALAAGGATVSFETGDAPGAGSALAAEGEETLPEEWLESFLLLDLPEHRAMEFWEVFEVLRQDMPLEAAWLAALRGACGDDTINVGSVVSGRSAKAARKEDDGVDIVYVASPRDETISEADADIRQVLFAWEPEADAQTIQLKVSPGARFLLSWSQPEEEGGFWAYGYVLGAREQLGYVPLHILAQRVEEATPAAVASSGKARRRRQAAPEVATQSPRTARLIESLLVDNEKTSGFSQSPAPFSFEEPLAPLQPRVELEDWAQNRLEKLTRQFCLAHLDAAVAFAALSICTSASEMREE